MASQSSSPPFSPSSTKGFTIVELLIVIVVIAILAAITVVAYNGMQDRARNTAVETNLASTVKALELFNADYGHYPANGTDWSVVKTSGLKLTTTKNNTVLYCIDTADPTTWTLIAARYPSKSSLWTSAGLRDNANSLSVGSGTPTCQTATGDANITGVWAFSFATIQ